MEAEDLKFRAWLKSDGKLYNVASIDFNNKRVNLNGADIVDFEDVELMQFTRIKDSNEQDVYEGDIVEIPDDTNHYIVVIDEFIGCVCLQKGEYRMPVMIPMRMTVIGNIYETPELLNE